MCSPQDVAPKAADEGSKLTHRRLVLVLVVVPPLLRPSLSGLPLTSFHLLQQLRPRQGKSLIHLWLNVN